MNEHMAFWVRVDYLAHSIASRPYDLLGNGVSAIEHTESRTMVRRSSFPLISWLASGILADHASKQPESARESADYGEGLSTPSKSSVGVGRKNLGAGRLVSA